MKGIIATNNRQLVFIYSETCPLISEYLLMLEKVCVPIRIINIDREKLADKTWIDLSERLNMGLNDIFDRKNLFLDKKNTDKLFDNGEWLNLIKKGMYILKFPIAIHGSKVEIIKNHSDINRMYAETGSTITQKVKQRNIRPDLNK